VLIPTACGRALSQIVPCLYGSFIQVKASSSWKGRRAEVPSLRRTKFDAVLDLPLKLICYSSVSLQVGCIDLIEAEVKCNIKSIMMEISLGSPSLEGTLLMTSYLKRLLP